MAPCYCYWHVTVLLAETVLRPNRPALWPAIEAQALGA